MDITTVNKIYLRRKNKLLLSGSPADSQLPDAYLVALQKNIEPLGYQLAPKALQALSYLSKEDFIVQCQQLATTMKELVGAHVQYKPMYPNFPEQVASAEDTELYINAYLHYFGDWLGRRILPEYEKQPRQALLDKTKFTVITLGNTADFKEIFTHLIQSKLALSPSDTADLRWFIQYNPANIPAFLQMTIPNKENTATIISEALAAGDVPQQLLAKHYKTATDVLRLMVAMSKGDVSLAEPTKLRSFTRHERRLLLQLLEDCHEITEDMLRHKEQWKRAGERLHPGEYKAQYPICAEAFGILRNNLPFTTFNSQLEDYLRGDVASALDLLEARPGELARRLDHLLRIAPDQRIVVDRFETVADAVSSTVLLQVFAHFKDRNQGSPLRVFFPKGNAAKAHAVANNLPKLSEAVRQEIIAICKQSLRNKYKTLSPLGKVYIDPELKRFTVPFALRSASKALKTVGRGSRLKIPNGNTLRFFIWWKDGKGRSDLDLSAVGLDEHSQFKMQISYYNLKETGAYHSGDITSAPDGASEFIDLEIDTLLNSGVRYIVSSINSYTEQPFCDLPECFAGFMVRQSPQSGEVYDPRTVENKIDITANTRISLPFIIDLKKKTAIWTDLALANNPNHNNNVINNMSTLSLMNEAMQSLAKPSLYDLFSLHAEARGQIVTAIEDADTVFSLTQGITPYDTAQIISQFA